MAESVDFKRYSLRNIQEALKDTPVVFIMGPRQSGKTTLVKSFITKDWQYLTLDDQAQLAIASADPAGFIKNLPEKPAAIDEIQRLPEMLLSIKQVVDENRMPGRFLLTGSTNALLLPQVSDSLAGRIEEVHLDTLSECEIRDVKPSFLSKLLACKAPSTKEIRVRDYLIQRIVTGCFPEPLHRKEQRRIKAWYKQYINSLVHKDIKDLSQIDHPEKMLKLLKLTTFYSSKLINFTELGNTIDLVRLTAKKYINLLEQLFLLKQLPAWHINQHKRLIKTSKLHITDTGLICAARDINAKFLLSHPNEFGFLLETFVFNELQKQANWLDEDVTFYHYRDKDKKEVDFIIENASSDCFAMEVKAAATLKTKDFSGLLRFKEVAGKRFKFGILLYDGDQTTAFAENIFAVPFAALWS